MSLSNGKKFQQIIQGCCQRNRSSQNDLYRLFYPYGMSICMRYVNNEAEATSVVNDGFLKVFKNARKYDSAKPFKPWFRKILVNTAINQLKKQKKFKMEVSMDEAKNISTREDALSRIGYQELMIMVQSLSLAYRTVFNMYVIDGFKHQEIADKLGITVSTSKSNLTRARAKLQTLVLARIRL
ncbi:MAG: RNA polymerase sigma-70 factor (ECF subfamily) [Granulosicoccus sp.]|jgi:RNA polymerase sigma-70 factor (ECF subfamily)